MANKIIEGLEDAAAGRVARSTTYQIGDGTAQPMTAAPPSLEPCPFADDRMEHRVRVRQDEIAYPSPATWRVLCHCGACGPNRENAEAAALAWNMRRAPIAEGRLRESLAFYAEEDRYEYDPTTCWGGGRILAKKRMAELQSGILEDRGDKARAALRGEP